MNQIETKQVLDLAEALMKEHASRTVVCAVMACDLIQAGTFQDRQDAAALAGRIYEVMSNADEPSYSMYDYADAIANATVPLDTKKLMALGDMDFRKSLIWLAEYKRETYEDRPHARPKPPCPIQEGS